jgi:Inner centromere protein, ARK binding region
MQSTSDAQASPTRPAKKAREQPQGLLSPDTLKTIDGYRVRELQTQLRERGKDPNGLKRVLRQRLIEALEEELREAGAGESKEEVNDVFMEQVGAVPQEIVANAVSASVIDVDLTVEGAPGQKGTSKNDSSNISSTQDHIKQVYAASSSIPSFAGPTVAKPNSASAGVNLVKSNMPGNAVLTSSHNGTKGFPAKPMHFNKTASMSAILDDESVMDPLEEIAAGSKLMRPFVIGQIAPMTASNTQGKITMQVGDSVLLSVSPAKNASSPLKESNQVNQIKPKTQDVTKPVTAATTSKTLDMTNRSAANAATAEDNAIDSASFESNSDGKALQPSTQHAEPSKLQIKPALAATNGIASNTRSSNNGNASECKENQTSHSRIAKEAVPCLSATKTKYLEAIMKKDNASSDTHTGSCIKNQDVLAKQEARKAKVAEMRNKSKTVQNMNANSSTQSVASAGSTISAQPLQTTILTNNKRPFLVQQMREKAAIATGSQKVNQSILQPQQESQLSHAPKMVQPLQSMQPPPPPPPQQAQQQGQPVAQQKDETQAHASQTPFDSKQPAKRVSMVDLTNSVDSKRSSKMFSPEFMSPMSTYDISDRDSDSESDGETEERRKEKTIPSWARKSKMVETLKECLYDNENNSDKLFGGAKTCDLEAVFAKKKDRYRKRGESARWSLTEKSFNANK